MKIRPIIIVAGEPKSIFFEIFIKCLKSQKFRSPLILISSIKILKNQMIKLGFKRKIKKLNFKELKKEKLNNEFINIIDVSYENDTDYINNCFKMAFKILRSNLTNKFINGPIDKSTFLKKKYLGITEFISQNFNRNKTAMLIYNKDLSVCPITTHLPIKLVTQKINQKIIREKIILINNFYKKEFKVKPKIGVTGLNPHCETISKINEDKKIVLPAINFMKKRKIDVKGPFPADTIFLKQNRTKFDVIIGMYHDQVLTPIKTLKEYDAINITLGLPFYRVSPDHGPNNKMINKNLSNPSSLLKSISFLDKR
tara:strand:- start:1392 stop:2327 length:936 start_codon:yes stop_codon:yes gene_type:complete